MFQVVFATPGMLHAGQSLQIFKKWAGNEKNMVRDYSDVGLRNMVIVIAIFGFCSAYTIYRVCLRYTQLIFTPFVSQHLRPIYIIST